MKNSFRLRLFWVILGLNMTLGKEELGATQITSSVIHEKILFLICKIC